MPESPAAIVPTQSNDQPVALPVVPKKIDTSYEIGETRVRYAERAWGSFVGENKPPLIHYGEADRVSKISPELWGTGENWFVLGDIHGDFFALLNCISFIQRQCPDFRLVFLGDLVDRGHHPMECLWLLLALAHRFPQRVLWLAGNHDVGVIEQADHSFSSTVQPAEFVDHLNKVDSWTPFRRQFGKEYIELVRDLPRAALSPDGILFTHGGFPHTDLQKNLASKLTQEEKLAWLNSTESLQDFTWTRITRYPSKIPNRASTGCSYGYKDFSGFCEATKEFFPTARLVTGHEHPDGGVDLHPEWKTHPALTLKGFGFDNHYGDPEAFLSRYQDNLVVGRCRTNDLPEVIEIPVDREDLAKFFEQEIEPEFMVKVRPGSNPGSGEAA